MDGPSERLRRSVNEIFGDELPNITRDEHEFESSDDVIDRERWLRDNIPPHHG